ncbi:hypothetical protein DFJ74DRAFT_680888 [Hyaloraphidium curvatum]|nr:hypothetical protein DFJ74DRAFT_680888 [Hyaloraphidium curvatum]
MADLEAENASLRAELAALRLEVDALRAEVHLLRHPEAGQLAPGAQPPVGDNRPVIPLELVLRVAEYFPPGSPTLLRMIKSCRVFHDLLTPRFLREFDAERAFSIYRRVSCFVGDATRATRLAAIKEPNLGNLDEHPFAFEKIFAQCCAALEELSFCTKETTMISYYLNYSTMAANVSRLQLLFKGSSHSPIRLNLPSLRYLDYRGFACAVLLKALVTDCPLLDTIDCEIEVLPDDCRGIMPEQFVAKIRTWRYQLDMGLQTCSPSPLSSPWLSSQGTPWTFSMNMNMSGWNVRGLRPFER